MNLRSVRDIIPQTKVILRLDLDLPFDDTNRISDNSRLLKSLPTIQLLLEKNCQILIIGHRGRPQGIDENLTLRPVYLELMTLLEPTGENLVSNVFYPNSIWNKSDQAFVNNQIVFWKICVFGREEANDPQFLAPLNQICQAYVNDAFAVAHRAHASITLWQHLPAFYGLSFIDEVEHLQKLVDSPASPLTLLLGGAKKTN